MKGTIISIEGTDGAGKHTQQQLLLEELNKKGYKTFAQAFPNYESDSAGPVKMYLSGAFGNQADCLDAYEASTLFATDRLCTYKTAIKPHYENGEIILLDRYVQSNFIHQCSKIYDENEQQKYLDWVQEFEFNTLHLPRPDVVFFIEMPVEKSLELARARQEYKTGEQKDIHEEDTEYMRHSYETGMKLAKKLGWNLVHCLDSEGNLKTIETIHNEIMEKVNEFLK